MGMERKLLERERNQVGNEEKIIGEREDSGGEGRGDYWRERILVGREEMEEDVMVTNSY